MGKIPEDICAWLKETQPKALASVIVPQRESEKYWFYGFMKNNQEKPMNAFLKTLSEAYKEGG